MNVNKGKRQGKDGLLGCGGAGGEGCAPLPSSLHILGKVRGDVKIHRLQPPYSAASCRQFI